MLYKPLILLTSVTTMKVFCVLWLATDNLEEQQNLVVWLEFGLFMKQYDCNLGWFLQITCKGIQRKVIFLIAT